MAPDSLFDAVFALYREAAAREEFEAAYHLLSAALHIAEKSGDIRAVETIIEIADQFGAAIDAQPDHPLSSEHATNRGTIPLFRSLRGTAQAMLARLKSVHSIAEHRD